MVAGRAINRWHPGGHKMGSFYSWMKKLQFLFQRRKFREDLSEELAFHREQLEQDLRSEGENAQTAHHSAARQFGNPTRITESSYEVIAFRAETVLQDLRFAVRQMWRSPGFALTSILILALGIGASVAIFAFVDSVLLQPLPYAHSKQLMDVTESLEMFPRGNLSYPDYLDWKRQNTVFRSMDVYSGAGYLLENPNGVEPVSALVVSAGFFRTLGVEPAMGRDFRAGEDALSAPPTTLISYSAWKKYFAGRPDIIGQTIQLSGQPTTIIGIMPASFYFSRRASADFFHILQPTSNCLKRRSCHNLLGVGRLKDGVTPQAALAEMKTIARQLELQYPDSNRGQSASVMPLARAVTGDIRPVLMVLMGGATLLLLIAYVNVSNLLLVRAEKRRREIAVRGALGASRSRLIRQYVTESVVLVFGGMLFGLLLSEVTMHALRGLLPPKMLRNMPFLEHLGLTLHVQLFAAGLMAVAVLLFSITPTLRMPALILQEGLNAGGRGETGSIWRKLGANLVIVELALAVVLLSSAGLLSKSFWKMLQVNLGFAPDHLATVALGLPESQSRNAPEITKAILTQVESVPGVRSAAVTTVLPVSCNCNTNWIRIMGKPYDGRHNEVNGRQVSAEFFQTLQARLISGRLFTERDDAQHPRVSIINEAFARKYFPGEDPIGKKLGNTALTPASLREIVGVVANIKDSELSAEQWPAEYTPFAQDPDIYFSLMVRTSQDEDSLLPTLVSTIRKANPNLGVENETTMLRRIHESDSAWLHRSAAWLVGGFAGLAFLLSIIGLYGTIAYSVSQRTREIGVRMALGAQKTSIYAMILKEAGKLSVFGIILGLGSSIAAATFMRNLLFGVRAWDLATLSGVACVLTFASLFASYLPAHRAAKVNPVEALRTE